MKISQIIEHCLLVIQNPGLRDDIKSLLKKEGLTQFKSFGNGLSAINQLDDEDAPDSYQLIFADFMLKDMDLEQFLTTLRNSPRCVSAHIFIVCTSNEVPELIKVAPLGLSGYIQKPFTSTTFIKLFFERFQKLAHFRGQSNLLWNDSAATLLEKKRLYEKVLEIHNENLKELENPQSRFDLGRNLAFLNRKEESLAQFKLAIDQFPGYSVEVKKFLKSVTFEEQKSSEDLNPEALKRLGSSETRSADEFYGQERIRNAMVVGGTLTERSNLKTTLAGLGIKSVSNVHAGEPALELLQEEKFDLLIFYAKLEDTNGLNFLNHIDEYKDILKLMIVTDTQFANLEKAFELKLDGFAKVPFTMTDISNSLNRMMIQKDLTHTSKSIAHLVTGAFLLSTSNHPTLSMNLIQKAYDSAPNDALVVLYLGLITIRLGDQDSGKTLCDHAVSLNKALKTAAIRLISKYTAIRDLDEQSHAKNQSKKQNKVVDDPNQLAYQMTTEAQNEIQDPETGYTLQGQQKNPASPSDSKDDHSPDYTIKSSKPSKKNQSDYDLVHHNPSSSQEIIDLNLNQNKDASIKPKKPKPITVSDFVNELLTQGKLESSGKNIDKSATQLNRKTIKNMLELGVSPASLPHKLDTEQIYTGNEIELQIVSGEKVKIAWSQVIDWITTDTLDKYCQNIFTNDLNKLGLSQAIEYSEIILNQIKLINSRIESAAQSKDKIQYLDRYIEHLGQLITEDMIESSILDQSDLLPSKSTIQKIKKANQKKDPKLYRAIGLQTIELNDLDYYYSQYINAVTRSKKDSGYSLQEFIKGLSHIHKPLLEIHNELYQNKKTFETDLMQRQNQTLDEELATDIAEKDQFSLECFKKIFTHIKKSNNQGLMDTMLEQFFNRTYKGTKAEDGVVDFLIAINEHERASQITESILKNGPVNTSEEAHLCKLSKLHFLSKNYKDAIETCKKLLKKGFGSEREYNMIGVSLSKLNKHKESIKYYKEGLVQHPESFKLCHNIAIALAKTKKEKEANEYRKRSLELKKTHKMVS